MYAPYIFRGNSYDAGSIFFVFVPVLSHVHDILRNVFCVYRLILL